MLFTMCRNATPDAAKELRTTVDPEIRRRAHERLPPAKLEKVEIQLRSYGAEDQLTEEEVVDAAAASRHAQFPVAVRFMIAGFGVAGAIGTGDGRHGRCAPATGRVLPDPGREDRRSRGGRVEGRLRGRGLCRSS